MNPDTNQPTQKETSEMLGCSRAMLDKYEQQGKLLRVPGSKPIRYFREGAEALADDVARRRLEKQYKPIFTAGDDPYWAGREREAEKNYQTWERQARQQTADIPFADFASIYRTAWETGLKGCTVFRPNAVTGAVLVRPEPQCQRCEAEPGPSDLGGT